MFKTDHINPPVNIKYGRNKRTDTYVVRYMVCKKKAELPKKQILRQPGFPPFIKHI